MKPETISPELLAFAREPASEEADAAGWPMPEELLRNRREWKKILAQRPPMAPNPVESRGERKVAESPGEAAISPTFDLDSLSIEPLEELVLRPRSPKPRSKRLWQLAGAAAILALAAGLWMATRPRRVDGPPIDPPIQADGGGQDKKQGGRLTPPERPVKTVEKRGNTPEKPDKQLAIPEKPEEKIVNKPDDRPPPGMDEGPDFGAILARIDGYGGGPLPVRDADFVKFRGEVAEFQKEHPGEKSPKLEGFLARSQPTADREKLYLEYRVKALAAAAPDAPEKLALYGPVAAFGLSSPALMAKSPPLLEFARKMPRTDDVSKSSLLARLERLQETEPGWFDPAKQGPMYLCVLPPELRVPAVKLREDMAGFATRRPEAIDEKTRQFLLRTRRVTDELGMIIPAYFNPNDANPNTRGIESWKQLIAAAEAIKARGIGPNLIVVVNPDRGPGQVVEDAYMDVINALRTAGAKVIGYVDFVRDEIPRQPEEIKRDIDDWLRLYPVQGFFFDHAPGDKAGVGPFADIMRRARQRGRGFVVSCPGPDSDEGYLRLPDAIRPDIIVVRNVRQVPAKMDPPRWVVGHDPSHFGALAYLVADPQLAERFIDLAVAEHVGWVYVAATNNNSLPPYLSDEIEKIQIENGKIRGLGPGAGRR